MVRRSFPSLDVYWNINVCLLMQATVTFVSLLVLRSGGFRLIIQAPSDLDSRANHLSQGIERAFRDRRTSLTLNCSEVLEEGDWRPCEIWIEKCEAARMIEDEFGTDKALRYLIGEKFLDYLEAAERLPDFRAEIPAFRSWSASGDRN